MKINKTIILSDIISIFIAFWLFIWIFMEMKCVVIINNRVLNVLFSEDLVPIKKLSLGRNKCQESESYALFNYSFSGIKEICVNTSLFLVDCSKSEGNQKVEEIPSKTMNIWRNKIMCVNHFTEEEQKSFQLENSKDDCEEGYKQCGFINKNTNTTKIIKKFCIKEKYDCPLNFIKITNDISEFENQEDIYNILSFDDDYYLVTSNKKTDNSIIIDVAISEGEYPCYEKKKYSSITPQFPGLNNYNNFNCTQKNSSEIEKDLIKYWGYDTRYTKFDTLSKENVLIENDLDLSYSKLPNLSNWKQDMYTGKFSLFYRDSYTVKEDCHEYNNIEKSIKTLNKIQTVRILFALVHIMIYVVLFSILGLMKVVFSWYHSLLFGVKVGISFIIFGANYLMIYYSVEHKKKLKDIEYLNECLDEVSQAISNSNGIEKYLNELSYFYFWEKIMWCGYCFFNFIETCRLVHKIYIRVKNKYRRNIAKKEIGADNLVKIFEKVRAELDKKKQRINWQETN